MPQKNDKDIFLPWEKPESQESSYDTNEAMRAVKDANLPPLSFDDDYIPPSHKKSGFKPVISFDDDPEETPIKDSEPPILEEKPAVTPAPPKTEAPKTEAPKAEAPKAEAPKAEEAPRKAEPQRQSEPPRMVPEAPEEGSPRFLLRLIAVLVAVCVLVAVLLAVINAVTKNRIADNTLKAKTESVLEIFDGGTSCELYRTEADGSEVYLVFSGADLIGYCTFVSSNGFGGPVDIMVGINSEYSTEGVSIVEMSETGKLQKANSASFLSQFMGGDHSDPTSGVDALSGATITSEAIKTGVSKAHSFEVDLAAVAADRGIKLLAPGEATSAPDTTEPETTEPDTTGIETEDPNVTDTADTENEETPSVSSEDPETDAPFTEQRPNGGEVYPIESTETDSEVGIEIPNESTSEEEPTEPETTEPETTETETTEPETTEETMPEWLPEDTEDDTKPEWLPDNGDEPETTEPETTEETMPEWLN